FGHNDNGPPAGFAGGPFCHTRSIGLSTRRSRDRTSRRADRHRPCVTGARAVWSPDRPSRRTCSGPHRSEEHTSELQSRFDLVCRLLLEKKNCTNVIAAFSYEIQHTIDSVTNSI